MMEPGKLLLGEVEKPAAGPGQVVIQIGRIGVCGSDIHVYRGEHPFVTYPLVQGHEYAGVVSSLGEGVNDLRIGDKVTATPQEVCGACPPCKRNQYNACQNLRVRGFQAPGCAQDFFVTEAEKVILLPENFDLDQGAFVEPVAVAVHSTGLIGDVSGKNIVVSGAGTIGNFVAQAFKVRGAKQVMITDVSNYRLNIARDVGIDETCNVANHRLGDEVSRIFGPQGFEVGAEVAGVEASLAALVSEVGNGGTILSIGVFGEAPKVDMALICEHELTVKGSMMYRHEDFEQAINWIAAGRIQTTPLISRRFEFTEYAEAYKFIESEGDRVMKVMINLD